MRHLLTERLGVQWRPARNGIAEIDGAPVAVLRHFSKRRSQIEDRLAIKGYSSGRAAQVAALSTRDRKTDPESVQTLRERWRVEATYEVSRPGLGSDFVFAKFIGRVRLHRPLFADHVLDAVAYVGSNSGSPPLPKRFFLGGLGTLRGFERKQFTGKDMVLSIFEWSWFPPSRFVPAVIPFYDGGALGGGGVASTGWKHDAGLGLRWPQTSRVFARVDAAVPFNPEPGQARKVQWNLRLQFPF